MHEERRIDVIGSSKGSMTGVYIDLTVHVSTTYHVQKSSILMLKFHACTQGLGLRPFTEQGWADSKHGRMYVGLGEHWITENDPVSVVRRTSTDVQYRAWVPKGQRLVSGDKCWWSPKGVSCTDYYESFTQPDGTIVPGGGGGVGEGYESTSDVLGSAQKMLKGRIGGSAKVEKQPEEPVKSTSGEFEQLVPVLCSFVCSKTLRVRS